MIIHSCPNTAGGYYLFITRKLTKYYIKLFRGLYKDSERGMTAIEVLLAMVILGMVGITFLGSIGTGLQATVITREQSIAEGLIQSEAEYIKDCVYQYDTSEYPVDPTLTIPAEWTVPSPTVVPVHGVDNGMQEVTMSAQYKGNTVLSITIYKVDR